MHLHLFHLGRKLYTSTNDKPVTVQPLPSLCMPPNHSKESLNLLVDDQIPFTCEKRESISNLTASLGPGILVPYSNRVHHDLQLDSDSTHREDASTMQDHTDDDNQTLNGNLLKDCQNDYLGRDLNNPKNMNLNQAYPCGIEDKHCTKLDTVSAVLLIANMANCLRGHLGLAVPHLLTSPASQRGMCQGWILAYQMRMCNSSRVPMPLIRLCKLI